MLFQNLFDKNWNFSTLRKNFPKLRKRFWYAIRTHKRISKNIWAHEKFMRILITNQNWILSPNYQPLYSYSRKDSRRKSTGGSNSVHAIVSGGAAKPLSPITRSGQQMPLSPLARTPSPGPERYQQVVYLIWKKSCFLSRLWTTFFKT